MPINTADGFLVNFKVETTEGTAATGGAGTGERLRVLASPGLKLGRGQIQSGEIRNDANAGKMRLGARMVNGTHNIELSQGSFDTLLEAVMRSTWTAPVTVTFDGLAALTSIQVTATDELTFAGTTTPTAFGLRVGDVFRLADMSTAANNAINLRVKSIAGSVVKVHGTPLTVQAADSACSLTIGKKLKQAATPVRRTFTVEEYLEDADVSELFVGCRPISLSLTLAPNGMVTATVGWMGLNRSTLASGASPYFTSPTEYTSIALVATDASITYNGTSVSLTGFTLNFAIAAQGEEVIGSTVMPGTFDNRMTVTGTISAVTQDLADEALYDAETGIEMSLLLVEPESEPKSYIGIYLPEILITDIEKPKGGDGALIRTKQFNAQPRVAATGYDAGVCTILTAA